jgi:hypothetical protein
MPLWGQALLGFAVLGLTAAAVGRAALGLLLGRPERSLSADRVLAGCLVGTAVLCLVPGWLSYLGLPMRLALGPVCAALLAVLLAGRRSLRAAWGDARPGAAGLLVAMSGGAMVLFALLPVGLGGCPLPFNDLWTYVSVARWLQDHPFSTPVLPDPGEPLSAPVFLYQSSCLRMGSTFLLALVAATLPGIDPLVLSAGVTAWGLFLNLAGMYLIARRAFLLRPARAGAVTLLPAVVFTPLLVSAQHGFLPQVFGTAYLLFALALLSRLVAPADWVPRRGLVVGLAVAALLTVYSELLPVLVLVGSAYLAVCLLRGYRAGRLAALARLGAVTAGALAVAGNVEWCRLLTGIRVQLHANPGFPIPWSVGEFCAFAMGGLPFRIVLVWKWQETVIPLLAGAAFLLGCARLVAGRRGWLPGLAVLLFAGLAGLFLLLPPAPGGGQSWAVYKLCKWACPLVLVVQGAGLCWLFRRGGRRAAIAVALLGGGLFLRTLGQYREQSHNGADVLRSLTGSSEAPTAWKALARQLDERGVRRVYLLTGPTPYPWPDALAVYFLYPRPFVNGWHNVFLYEVRRPDPPHPLPPDVAVLHWNPPFSGAGVRLAGNVTLVDRSHPLVIQVEELGAAGAPLPRLHLWSDHPGPALLSLEVAPATALTLEWRFKGGPAWRPLSATREGRLECVVALPAGRSCMELRGPGVWSVRDVRLSFVSPSEAARAHAPGRERRSMPGSASASRSTSPSVLKR